MARDKYRLESGLLGYNWICTAAEDGRGWAFTESGARSLALEHLAKVHPPDPPDPIPYHSIMEPRVGGWSVRCSADDWSAQADTVDNCEKLWKLHADEKKHK
jgi:hypothetical protein